MHAKLSWEAGMDYSNTCIQEKHEVLKWPTVGKSKLLNLQTIFSVLHYTFAEKLDSVYGYTELHNEYLIMETIWLPD